MKIQFNEKVRLVIEDRNWGTESRRTFDKGQIVDVEGVVPNTHNYHDIHFGPKIVAEGVYVTAFAVI
jgi:hypothetical protein